MKHPPLPRQALRTTHTPAILDFGSPTAETLANAGFGGSTPANEAVHACGLSAWQPNGDAASRMRSHP